MTKQRHCFVTQVGDAIEALASALDPERKPPFSGDILDLLEWAEKDVLELRSMFAELDRVAAHNYATKEAEIAELRQQLASAQERIEGVKEQRDVERAAYLNEFEKNQVIVVKNAQLCQQLASRDADVKLLREPLIRIDEVAKTSKTIISVAAATWKMLDKIRTALNATEPKP